MRIKFPYILPIAIALAATSSAGFAAELDLWFTPLSSEGPMKAPLTKWLKESLPKELPGVTVAHNFGPPDLPGWSAKVCRSRSQRQAGCDRIRA